MSQGATPQEFRRWLSQLVGSAVSFDACSATGTHHCQGVVESDANGELRVNCGSGVYVYPSSAEAFSSATVVQQGTAPRATSQDQPYGSPPPREPDEAREQRGLIFQTASATAGEVAAQRTHRRRTRAARSANFSTSAVHSARARQSKAASATHGQQAPSASTSRRPSPTFAHHRAQPQAPSPAFRQHKARQRRR